MKKPRAAIAMMRSNRGLEAILLHSDEELSQVGSILMKDFPPQNPDTVPALMSLGLFQAMQWIQEPETIVELWDKCPFFYLYDIEDKEWYFSQPEIVYGKAGYLKIPLSIAIELYKRGYLFGSNPGRKEGL